MKLSEVKPIENSVIINSYIFWDIKQCSLLKSIDVSEEQVGSIFRAEEIAKQGTMKKRRNISPKLLFTFNRLHDVTPQKTELFITITVRTSHPIQCNS
jgi:hypothetical protein